MLLSFWDNFGYKLFWLSSLNPGGRCLPSVRHPWLHRDALAVGTAREALGPLASPGCPESSEESRERGRVEAEGRSVDFAPGSSSAGETGSEAGPQDPSCWLRAHGSHGMQENPMWNQETLQWLWARDAWILPPKILRRQEGLSFLAAQSRVVPGSFSAANLGSGFDRWSCSSPAALTQQGLTPRVPAVPLDPDWEGRNQPGRSLGVIGAPSARNAVPGEAGNDDTGCLDDPTLHSRCCQGKSHAGTQPGSGSPLLEILLNPILPPAAFPALQRRPWIIFFS